MSIGYTHVYVTDNTRTCARQRLLDIDRPADVVQLSVLPTIVHTIGLACANPEGTVFDILSNPFFSALMAAAGVLQARWMRIRLPRTSLTKGNGLPALQATSTLCASRCSRTAPLSSNRSRQRPPCSLARRRKAAVAAVAEAVGTPMGTTMTMSSFVSERSWRTLRRRSRFKKKSSSNSALSECTSTSPPPRPDSCCKRCSGDADIRKRVVQLRSFGNRTNQSLVQFGVLWRLETV